MAFVLLMGEGLTVPFAPARRASRLESPVAVQGHVGLREVLRLGDQVVLGKRIDKPVRPLVRRFLEDRGKPTSLWSEILLALLAALAINTWYSGGLAIPGR